MLGMKMHHRMFCTLCVPMIEYFGMCLKDIKEGSTKQSLSLITHVATCNYKTLDN